MTDKTTRRAALLGAGALVAAGALAARAAAEDSAAGASPRKAEKPLKLLVLGGTRFLGPAIVERARARGHTVTLFNRGRSNPGLYPDLETLHGNRGSHGGGGRPPAPVDLSALEGRAWDAAIDTSGYWPEFQAVSSKQLAGQVGHYVFVSTISVYPGFGANADTIDESSTLGDLKPREAYEGFQYGPFKALCEQATEAAMPGRVSNVRPGLIVGPRDDSDRFTYWPVRVHRGGEVLAPGKPEGHCQFIDVRDLGAWLVHLAETRAAGVFNATGFDGHLSMQEFLHGCKCAIRTDCEFTWVSEAFLETHKVQPFMQLPLWIPADRLPLVKADKAIRAGLAFRPVSETVRDTLAWALGEPRQGRLSPRVGLPADRERELLAAWREAQKGAEKPAR